jgi:hypothetical protein
MSHKTFYKEEVINTFIYFCKHSLPDEIFSKISTGDDLKDITNTGVRNDFDKNKTDFSQHFCTNVFTVVADLQVQCL